MLSGFSLTCWNSCKSVCWRSVSMRFSSFLFVEGLNLLYIIRSSLREVRHQSHTGLYEECISCGLVCWAGGYQADANGIERCLRPALHAEFTQDVADMCLDGFLTYLQVACDLFV